MLSPRTYAIAACLLVASHAGPQIAQGADPPPSTGTIRATYYSSTSKSCPLTAAECVLDFPPITGDMGIRNLNCILVMPGVRSDRIKRVDLSVHHKPSGHSAITHYLPLPTYLSTEGAVGAETSSYLLNANVINEQLPLPFTSDYFPRLKVRLSTSTKGSLTLTCAVTGN